MEEEKNKDTNVDIDETTKNQITELNSKISNVVEELKKEREQKNVYKDMLDSINNKKETPPENQEVDKVKNIIREVLNEENVAKAKTNKQVAFEKFIAEHKDFHPDNDPTGLKREALQKKFNAFNPDGLTTVEDFYSVTKDAYILLRGNDTNADTFKEIPNPYSSTKTSTVTPGESNTSKLS